MKKTTLLLSLLTLISLSNKVLAQEEQLSEKITQEYFHSFIQNEWKPLKVFLNDKEVPATVVRNTNLTFKDEGVYTFKRNDKLFYGKWTFIEEGAALITDDEDGIEKHKVLLAKGKRLVTETLLPDGVVKIEYQRVD